MAFATQRLSVAVQYSAAQARWLRRSACRWRPTHERRPRWAARGITLGDHELTHAAPIRTAPRLELCVIVPRVSLSGSFAALITPYINNPYLHCDVFICTLRQRRLRRSLRVSITLATRWHSPSTSSPGVPPSPVGTGVGAQPSASRTSSSNSETPAFLFVFGIYRLLLNER